MQKPYMYRLLFFIIIIVSLSIACHKSQDNSNHPISKSLVRTWIFTEQKIGMGGPGQWTTINPPNQSLRFNADSTFTTSVTIFTGVHNYTVIDSVSLKLTPASNYNSISVMRYSIDTLKGILELTPTVPLCIEGCSYRFKAQ
jgi:hypothetical protein